MDAWETFVHTQYRGITVCLHQKKMNAKATSISDGFLGSPNLVPTSSSNKN